MGAFNHGFRHKGAGRTRGRAKPVAKGATERAGFAAGNAQYGVGCAPRQVHRQIFDFKHGRRCRSQGAARRSAARDRNKRDRTIEPSAVSQVRRLSPRYDARRHAGRDEGRGEHIPAVRLFGPYPARELRAEAASETSIGRPSHSILAVAVPGNAIARFARGVSTPVIDGAARDKRVESKSWLAGDNRLQDVGQFVPRVTLGVRDRQGAHQLNKMRLPQFEHIAPGPNGRYAPQKIHLLFKREDGIDFLFGARGKKPHCRCWRIDQSRRKIERLKGNARLKRYDQASRLLDFQVGDVARLQ